MTEPLPDFCFWCGGSRRDPFGLVCPLDPDDPDYDEAEEDECLQAQVWAAEWASRPPPEGPPPPWVQLLEEAFRRAREGR